QITYSNRMLSSFMFRSLRRAAQRRPPHVVHGCLIRVRTLLYVIFVDSPDMICCLDKLELTSRDDIRVLSNMEAYGMVRWFTCSHSGMLNASRLMASSSKPSITGGVFKLTRCARTTRPLLSIIMRE